jgi:adenylate cyclase
MNELFFAESSAWLTQVGLAGKPEPEIVFGFCERCVAAGLPLARGLVAIDTLDRRYFTPIEHSVSVLAGG